MENLIKKDVFPPNVAKCQCCFSILSPYHNKIKVSEDIERRYFELLQIAMNKTMDAFPVICLHCDSKLKEFSDFKQRVLRLMNENMNITIKTESETVPLYPIVKIECESDYSLDADDFEGSFKMEMIENQIEAKPERKRKSSSTPLMLFYCEICPQKSYKSKYALEKHMSMSHKVSKKSKEKFPKVNLCSICAKLITNGKRGLEYHMARVHSEDFKYFCDLCPRKAKMRSDLESHMKSHIKKEFREKFPCETCGETFNQRQSLEMHIIMKHTSTPPKFNCDCGKSFRTLKHFKYHQREMHDTVLMPCDKCSKVFNTKIKLNRHQREFHAQDKPCPICGKLIRGTLTMARHLKGHQSPDFRCTYDGCNRQFFGKSALSDHIATKHEKNESFICPTCGSSFATIRNMNKHIQRQHTSAKIPCQILSCKYVTSRKDYLASHYKTHKDIDEAKRNELIEGIRDIRGIGW